jgi:hypothetical protein
MRIADFSLHEMKRVWTNDHYADRTKDSFTKLFESIRESYESKTLVEFLRPYMWKLSDNDQLRQTANRLLDKEARLWITMDLYIPTSKYEGDVYVSLI